LRLHLRHRGEVIKHEERLVRGAKDGTAQFGSGRRGPSFIRALQKSSRRDRRDRRMTLDTGQQWDAPNGSAPLRWIAVEGLSSYGQNRRDDHVPMDGQRLVSRARLGHPQGTCSRTAESGTYGS
jgi:hypothetical protein